MKCKASQVFVAASAALLMACPALADDRFAVVLGNNIGGPLRDQLRYSQRDADRFAKTLIELGHFAPNNVIVLHDQGVAALRKALEQAGTALGEDAAGEGSLLLFFYAGHANPGGLELGTEQYTYSELKQSMEQSKAATKLVIVDACDSGVLTSVRGARLLEVLETPLAPIDRTRGVAYVSSTAIGEAAQESPALEGGFFTTHFDAGLRGAADDNADGIVTLSEAFRYTASKTTTDTSWTRAGPQHPTYEQHLSGRGDLVLTDLRRAETRLVLPPTEGASFILHNSRGIFGEIQGAAKPVTVGLPSGRYEVEERRGNSVRSVSIFLDRGDNRELPALKDAILPRTGLRGDTLPLHVALAGAIASAPLPGWGGPSVGGALAVSRAVGPLDLQLRVSLRNAWYLTDSLLSGSIGVATLWPLFHFDRVTLEAGPEAAIGNNWQRRRGGEVASAGEYIVGGRVIMTAGANWLRFGPEFAVNAHMFNYDSKLTILPAVVGSFFVGF